jgi:hypothetical protein
MGKSNFADEFLSSYPFVRISYKNTHTIRFSCSRVCAHTHTHTHTLPFAYIGRRRELKEMCCRFSIHPLFYFIFYKCFKPVAIKYIRCRSHERTTTNRNNRTSSPRCTLYYLFIYYYYYYYYFFIYFTTPRYENKAIKDRRRRHHHRSPVLIINRNRVYLFCHNTLAYIERGKNPA